MIAVTARRAQSAYVFAHNACWVIRSAEDRAAATLERTLANGRTIMRLRRRVTSGTSSSLAAASRDDRARHAVRRGVASALFECEGRMAARWRHQPSRRLARGGRNVGYRARSEPRPPSARRAAELLQRRCPVCGWWEGTNRSRPARGQCARAACLIASGASEGAGRARRRGAARQRRLALRALRRLFLPNRWVVVGGGDAALQDALVLAPSCRSVAIVRDRIARESRLRRAADRCGNVRFVRDSTVDRILVTAA